MYAIYKKSTIYISKLVQEVFLKYRQTSSTQVEACGVLIGNHKTNGDILIKVATNPQANDRRYRNSFILHSPSHQYILDQHFTSSDNEDVYIGTWHTHPQSYPIPSKIDIEDWKKQYKANCRLFNLMVFCIVGIRKTKLWIIKNSKIELISRRKIKYV